MGQSGYSGTIPVSGGNGRYRNLSVTGLPPGLTAALSGDRVVVSGTPTRVGTYSLGVSVQDGRGVSAGRAFTLAVNLGFATTSLPAATAGRSYGATIAAAGGSGQYTLTVSPAAAASFSLSASSTSVFTNDAVRVTVTPLDAYGNATAYSGPVTVASSNGQVMASASVTLSGGQGSVNMTALHSGSVTLSASAGSLGSNSVTVGVAPSLYSYNWRFFATDANGNVLATYDYTNAAKADALAANDRDAALQYWARTLAVNWYAVGWVFLGSAAAN